MRDKIIDKNIWIFHHYATPPTMNGFTRPYNFGVNLNKRGYKMTVFAASYLHFSDLNLINSNDLYITNNEAKIPFVFVKTPSSSSNGVGRVYNMISYYKNLFKVTKEFYRKGEKPDLIIASSPHPLAMVAGIKIAKDLGVPCISEIRDFWSEVFFMGGKLKEDSIIGRMLIKGEHWIYNKSDALIFLKEGDYTYITDKKWDTSQGGNIDLGKCYYINNGVNIEGFNQQRDNEKLEDNDLNNGKFNVVYTGAIRPINNVGNILDAAKLLKDKKEIQFLIFGDGNQLEILKKRVTDENIKNVKMKGYVDKKYMPYVLSKSSVNILNYSQSKYNWSRGNSSNKLFEYMASGKPIISTVKMGYSPIDKYDCGITLDNDTPEALAEAVLEIFDMPEDRYKEICINAWQGAKDFDYKELTKKLISVIESQIS
jgi:glycosyltransferase involved in cell wall biosynthesis